MPRIVFFALPFTGPMNTSLRLAKTLRARGHHVIFAGMADAGPLVERYGFSFVPLFADWFPPGYIRAWTGGPTSRSPSDALAFYLAQRRAMIDHERFVEHLIRGGHREFARRVAELAPDLLLLDYDLHAYWAVMASQLPLPAAYFSPVLPMLEDPVTPPVDTLLPPARDLPSRLAVRWAWSRTFARRWLRNRALSLAGVPDPIDHIRELARACRYPLERLHTRSLLMPTLELPMIVACPADLDFPESRDRPRVHYADAAIDLDRDEPAFPWSALDPRKRLIYCSLGSLAFSPSFFQHVLDAASLEPTWQLVLNLGPSLSPADLSRVPPSAILVNGAPQLALLRRAAAMITHAGFGSAKECIHFGVPSLSFPLGFDQPGVAARLAHHGLGLLGSFPHATPASIHALLSHLLGDPTFRTRAHSMQAVFHAHHHAQSGAVALEHILTARRPPV
jgi:UDP:flavonoid glycosyltransferase YjiC (YdhE family)